MRNLKEHEGLKSILSIFISNFLMDSFTTRVSDTFSNMKIQGTRYWMSHKESILSVTLFNIKINNIMKYHNPEHCTRMAS